MASNILLVGCGVTSSITGKLLQSECHSLNLTLWEKLSEPGGRFSTISGGKSNELLTDLGAQYITTSEETMTNYNKIYSSLLSNNVIASMNFTIRGMKKSPSTVRNYVPVSGMKSVVNHFLKEVIYKDICYKHKLTALNKNGQKWNAVTESGKEELFDIVILTIPILEILKLTGDVQAMLVEDSFLSEQLRSVKYSSRYAVGLFFEEDVDTDCDSEYVDNDSVIRYIAYDRSKRNYQNKFRAATVHTTVQFGEKYSNADSDAVKEIVLQCIKNKFNHWPEPSSVATHFWNYSQIIKPYDSKPGAIVLSKSPLLIAGGDGFIGSTFDQCLFSSKTICDILLNDNHLKGRK